MNVFMLIVLFVGVLMNVFMLFVLFVGVLMNCLCYLCCL
jgi:hypothetical protein